MEGAMFYWISWMYWIYLTFIVDKQHPYRVKLAAGVLLIIIFSDLHLTFGNFELYGAGLFLLLVSYYLISQENLRAIIYFYICSFIVTIGYVTFHLFEIFDPVWIVFNKEWMMGICFTILAILLQNNLKGRLLIITCGTMQGEVLYAYFLNNYHFSYPVGSFSYLDVCMLISALLIGWSSLENSGTFFANYVHFLGKSKQKSS